MLEATLLFVLRSILAGSVLALRIHSMVETYIHTYIHTHIHTNDDPLM